jgi:hypothetical protein
MAERLADDASRSGNHSSNLAQHLEVVAQFGIHLREFQRGNRMQVCYDGELFRQVLTNPRATVEQRAHAALSLSRTDCINPNLGPTQLTRRLLVAREVKYAGRVQRRFEELSLDDLSLVRGADSPDALCDFGWWQDPAWKRNTLALH